MKSIVVAYDENLAIGKDGDLPWGRSLPADLANFKKITLGGSLIMGRKTFQSIGHALPGRQNIVVSRAADFVAPNIELAGSIDQAFALATKPIFIVGGSEIYQQTLSLVDRIFATKVRAKFQNCDSFFTLLNTSQWRLTAQQFHAADDKNLYDFDFLTFERRD